MIAKIKRNRPEDGGSSVENLEVKVIKHYGDSLLVEVIDEKSDIFGFVVLVDISSVVGE